MAFSLPEAAEWHGNINEVREIAFDGLCALAAFVTAHNLDPAVDRDWAISRPYQFTNTTNHRALTATFEKIRISNCFVCSTPIKSRLNILHGGSQLEQPKSC